MARQTSRKDQAPASVHVGLDSARDLAECLGGKAVPFEEMRSYLKTADVVISATAAPHYILLKGDIEEAMAGRESKLLLIDIANPTLIKSFGVSGYPITSRMSGEFVYVLAQQCIYDRSELIGPKVYEGESSVTMAASSIHYDPSSIDISSFVNVMAIDIVAMESNHTSVLAGYTSTLDRVWVRRLCGRSTRPRSRYSASCWASFCW